MGYTFRVMHDKKKQKKEKKRRTKLEFSRSIFLTVRRSHGTLRLYQSGPVVPLN